MSNTATMMGLGSGAATQAPKTRAYVACSASARFTALDISDPSNITVLSSLYDGTILNDIKALDLDIERNAAILVSSQNRIITVDISDPTNMSIIGSLQDAYNLDDCEGVKVNTTAQVAYVTTEDDYKFTIVDISNLSSPSVVGQIQNSASFVQLRAVEFDADTDTAYILSYGTSRVMSIDVSTASSPAAIQFLQNTTTLTNVTFSASDFVNKKLYVTTHSGASSSVASVDITSPSSMSVLDTINPSGQDECWSPAIDLTRSVLFVPSNTGPITMIDVSDPSNMTEISYQNIGASNAYAVHDDATSTLYVSWTNNIKSFDTTDTSALVELDALNDTTNLYFAGAIVLA